MLQSQTITNFVNKKIKKINNLHGIYKQFKKKYINNKCNPKDYFIFFFFRILNIFNTHTWREGRKFFKETYSDVYPKATKRLLH